MWVYSIVISNLLNKLKNLYRIILFNLIDNMGICDEMKIRNKTTNVIISVYC